MRFARSITTLAVTMLAAIPLTSASAERVAIGQRCGVAALSDPTSEPGFNTGTLFGGPIVGYESTDPLDPASVYLICTIQVNQPTHAGADSVRTEAWAFYAAVQPPVAVRYAAQPGDSVFVCTEVWVGTSDGHVSIYYSAATDSYSLDPNVMCELQVSA